MIKIIKKQVYFKNKSIFEYQKSYKYSINDF
jgi:hypothetical protein